MQARAYLDHAKHAVKLPVDEEDDEEVVSVPESLKVLLLVLVERGPDHSRQTQNHDPACRGWADEEEHVKISQDSAFGRRGVDQGKMVHVHHVGEGTAARVQEVSEPLQGKSWSDD